MNSLTRTFKIILLLFILCEINFIGYSSASASMSIGEPFLVNTTIADWQEYAVVAMNDSGQFVVGWRSLGQDGDRMGVYAQRFDRDGKPMGSEFQVNTYTQSEQLLSSLDINNRGELVVVWTSWAQDGNELGIFGQRYDADGSPIGNEFQLNSIWQGNQTLPYVSLADTGSFVVTWTDNSTGQDQVVARRFDASGSALGTEFRVNNVDAPYVIASGIATNMQGDFAIVYVTYPLYHVYVHRYAADGTPMGSEIQVDHFGNVPHAPTIAMDSVGNSVIAWRMFPTAGEVAIYGQRFDESGVAQGTEFLVDTGYLDGPQSAMNAKGEFVITWIKYDPSLGKYAVMAQPFTANGERMGDTVQPGAVYPSIYYSSVAGIDTTGRFVVAWQDVEEIERGLDIFARLYSNSDNLSIPSCSSATASPATIWTPNHKFVTVNIIGVTDPDGDPVTITINSIFQDEPVTGDSKSMPDGMGVGTSTVQVRAERAGKGNGRVYEIGFTADDKHGGSCNGKVFVGVPHDKKDTPINDGASYDSTVVSTKAASGKEYFASEGDETSIYLPMIAR